MTPAPLTKTLEFEKKNQNMPKLPKHVKVQKRPIPHPSTPSPYSGSSSPKTIYVSSSSPTMGVVKRVQKYLRAAENRATAKLLSGNNKGKKGDRRNQFAQLAQSNEALKKEEVFVKATGRAMERALKVGKWFEARGEDYTVSVKTGSVLLKGENAELSKSAMRKRKRAVARLEGEQELPETRTRWVNMVEVAVSLK
ncbi:Major Facilitator Superfamily protein [Aspergillus niger]|uniref:Major Facilitator Superfamily protein n=1 Tax=Aspergillus niger TaxID=5061 RepID=A0A505I530_ASPNG|nr:Major Facilitator Superfamily protein [Aspergillus niger]